MAFEELGRFKVNDKFEEKVNLVVSEKDVKDGTTIVIAKAKEDERGKDWFMKNSIELTRREAEELAKILNEKVLEKGLR